MITSKFFKYWLMYFVSLTYLFCEEVVKVIPWETPKHLLVIMGIVSIIGSFFSFGMIISSAAEDMMARKDSIELFGYNKLWRIWQWVAFPMFIWCIYKWDNFVIMAMSGVFYFGMKCLISNHNKHIDAYNQEMIVRQARQESAEKVTL